MCSKVTQYSIYSAMSALSSSSYTHPGLELLHLLLASLHGDLFSFIQTVLEVFNGLLHVFLHTLQVSAGVSFHLLLQTKGLIPAATLSFKRALQGIHNSLLVSLCLFHLFIFLCQLALDVGLNLVELKLGSENLPFFMFQRGLEKPTGSYKVFTCCTYIKVLRVLCQRKQHTSASSKAVCISDFSCSNCFRIFSSS
uniref:Uncharacterized protein n=1 Tax=Mastacembelus armatus TaxID=205130 RepID=A0A7N8XDH9_9TELE